MKLVDIEMQHDKKGTSVINILMENMSGAFDPPSHSARGDLDMACPQGVVSST